LDKPKFFMARAIAPTFPGNFGSARITQYSGIQTPIKEKGTGYFIVVVMLTFVLPPPKKFMTNPNVLKKQV
jgi:hypothetical protein